MTSRPAPGLLVVFGAGASYDADAKAVVGHARMPLSAQLLDTQYGFPLIFNKYQRCQPMFLRLRKLMQEHDCGLEEALGRYISRGESGTNTVLQNVAMFRLYLREVINAVTSDIRLASVNSNNYVALLESVQWWAGAQRDAKVCLVTFNYDRLLEDAIGQVWGREFKRLDHYGWKADLGVFKPHGSIDWYWPTDQSVLEMTLDALRSGQVTPTYAGNDAILSGYSPDGMTLSNHGHAVLPALALPTDGKHFVGERELKSLWAFLPQVSHFLSVGWAGQEPHVITLLENGLRPGIRGQAVVGGTSDADAVVAALDVAKRLETLSLELTTSALGFTGWLASNGFESFIDP